ncbi:MAG: polymer-forming cytoskeletal protein [Halanaeroarchaeum sp.]
MSLRVLREHVFGRDPIDRLVIPDETTVEEHDLVTDGDVLVGGQSTVEFGVRGANLLAGERVSFGGDVELEGDVRLDMWCEVDGNALVGADAYLGERVHVTGRLVVGGDLDIGDDVQIDEGFEANGWIVIRNPMPTITFFVVYLTHLLRIGEEEEAADLLEDLARDRESAPLQIPRSARVSDEIWQVSTPAEIGDRCRLHGNVRAQEIDVGEDNNLFGSLRAREDVVVGSGTTVHGDVTSREGDVTVEQDAVVLGDVAGEDILVHQDADVDGTIRARGAMRLGRPTRRDPE